MIPGFLKISSLEFDSSLEIWDVYISSNFLQKRKKKEISWIHVKKKNKNKHLSPPLTQLNLPNQITKSSRTSVANRLISNNSYSSILSAHVPQVLENQAAWEISDKCCLARIQFFSFIYFFNFFVDSQFLNSVISNFHDDHYQNLKF